MFTLKFYVSILPLLSTLHSATAVPSRAYCRCVTFNENEPWASSPALLDASRRDDICSKLGPELELWRHGDPAAYAAYFDELVEENVWYPPPEDELKPLPTGVLMEISMPRNTYHYEGPPSSAPTVPPRIVCRSESPRQVADPDSDSSLFYMAVILTMIFLACVAEFINILLARLSTEKASVRLPGSEKRLRAWSSPDCDVTDGLNRDDPLSDPIFIDEKAQ
ncbi:uncharacterized protein BDZ99DRAFT_466958 [Mytilinidion resinicola]|uniref:Uncharacterized protein n=1 Tax=Mytilinidion resinicola TaxID=574789 RepID=A0A6A6YBV8_9PEZI|nr:uncharacterized protein BDZ99DRAFT_466958 [Mytilinidion resinicola]KAF2805327.1 hypothetical protein BDZ99DRAFT_466958 [Mytilinidion resinicola]